MTPNASDINLGDLARALRACAAADPQDVAAIADALGFSLIPETARATEAPRRRGAEQESRTWSSPTAGGPDEDCGAAAGADRPPVTLARVEDLPLLPIVDVQRTERQRPWELADDALERFDEAVHLAGIALHEPLLDPMWSRQVLTHTLATPRNNRGLNAEAAVEIIASGRPLDPLPQLVHQSLARGAQVLVDVGDGMAPFARDAWSLVSEVERVVGHSQVEMRMFDEVLQHGCGSGPIWTWTAYKPPPPGTPALVLTDLGLSGGDGTSPADERGPQWLDIAGRLKANGSPLAFFVPYGSDRWPPALSGALVLIEWDRSTTVGAVHTLRDVLQAAVTWTT